MSDVVRFLGSVANYAGAVPAAFGISTSDIIGSLIKIPKPPSELSQQSGSQVYNLQSAQNQVRLQQAKPLLYGRFRAFPDLVSQPWSEYVDNQQIYYQLMGVTLGKADAESILIGDTAIQSYAETTYALYQPGDLVNLFHTNVATNAELQSVAIISANAGTVAGTHDYSGSTITPTYAGTPFSVFTAGQQIMVSGTLSNNGVYTVASIAGGGATLSITGVFETEMAIDGQVLPEESPNGKPTPPTRSVILRLGDTTGEYFVGPAGQISNEMAFDIEFPRGLFSSNASTGAIQSASVSIRFEYRREGTATWTTLQTKTFTAASATPQRFSVNYLVAAGTERLQARLKRVTALSTSTQLVNDAKWTGLRAYLPNATHGADMVSPDLTILAVKIRVTDQLSGGNSQRINGVFQRKLPVWNGSAWVEQATSSVVWAFADIVRNANYGLGLPDSALNLPELIAQDAAFTARGFFFNGYFDRAVTAWEAMKSIARCGNATPITDGRTFTLLVDEQRTLRAAMFTDRNVVKDSFTFNFATRKPETPRGLRVSYHDPVSFQVKSVVCGDENSATDLTLFGCASRTQAWKVGNQVLAETLYRRLNVSWQTERDGFVPNYGTLVSVQSFWADFGQSTEVQAVASDNRTLTLADPFDWSRPGPYAVQLRSEDGTPTAALPCVRGSSDAQVVLNTAAPITIYTGDDRTRTHISLASNGSAPMNVLVRSIKASGREKASLTGVIDDARVYLDPGPVPAE